MAAFELTTARLILTPFAPADVAALHTIFLAAPVRRFLLDDEQVTETWVQAEVSASERLFAERGCGLWTLRERKTGAIVGFAGFRPYFDPPQLQMLYGLAPEVWGRGLATEAARAVIAYAFGVLGFKRIEAAVDAPNVDSIAVLQRLGFCLIRTTEQGAYGHMHFYALAP